MKKVLILLAVLLAFTFTAMAQTESQAGGTGQATTTKAKKSKKSAAGETGQAASTAAAKESQLTGCLSAQAGSDGNYTLTNGHYKKGVSVGPADTVKDHAGHKVKLNGTWSEDKKTFNTTKVTHIADTCTAGGEKSAAKAEGKTKKGKSGAAGTPPPQL